MELKVWVDGLQRVVCGLAERTTCQEVIYALAHATGKTGRFVLVEKWRTSERSLSPHDRPLELLSKWGEYSNDVQFVLRCLEDTTTTTNQHQRPSSVIQQRGSSGKFLKNAQQISSTNPSSETSAKSRHRPNNTSMDENNTSGQIKNSTSTDLQQPTTQGLKNHNGTVASTTTTILKPYFVDTSNPLPESGTLVRPSPSSSSSGVGAGGGGCVPTTQLGYEVTNPAPTLLQQNFLLRRTNPTTTTTTCALSPTGQRTPNANMSTSGDKKIVQGRGSLTVLSQSTHDSLNSQTTNTTMSTTMDSSGTQIYLENSSYSAASSVQQQQSMAKQMDLSQTSFCNSSLSSTTSNQSTQAKRPPPPSYDSFVMMHRRTTSNNVRANDQRSGQSSPLPIFNNTNGHYHQGLLNRSRTPISSTGHQQQQQQQAMPPLVREQLIKVIENQQFQLQTQFQAMRSFDNEIAQCHQDPTNYQGTSPLLDHLRRELQQLEVERVHVKQKVEELRRQDLDSQLLSLRQNLSETLTESGKLDDQLRSMDAQLIANQEKMRFLNLDLEKEKQDIFQNLTSAPSSISTNSNYGLNDNLLSNDVFESRIKNLDEILKEKRRQLDDGQNIERSIDRSMGDRSIGDRLVGDRLPDRPIGVSIIENQNRISEMKTNRSRSFDNNLQQSTTMGSEMGNQRQHENAAGVWV